MKQKELSELTDQELLQEAKKMKTNTIIDAVFIGFLAGIVCFSVFANSWGFLTLIPLFLIYKLVKKPKDKQKEFNNLLNERNLK
ncbi:MAG: FUSC family protein [Crocinitomicaceae bacterium]|nr:FUSC family protein [Crocinitomicaceae bacterium]NGF75428.1 FUSC family protein [Fluviicola sp. SGL-29]